MGTFTVFPLEWMNGEHSRADLEFVLGWLAKQRNWIVATVQYLLLSISDRTTSHRRENQIVNWLPEENVGPTHIFYLFRAADLYLVHHRLDTLWLRAVHVQGPCQYHHTTSDELSHRVLQGRSRESLSSYNSLLLGCVSILSSWRPRDSATAKLLSMFVSPHTRQGGLPERSEGD